MARLGFPVHVTEAVLNHRSGTISGVAAIYNRYSYLDEKRAVTTEIAEAVRRAAAAHGISGADYLRGALVGRLAMDGVSVRLLPNLQRLASTAGRLAPR